VAEGGEEITQINAPLGLHAAKVDEKGRLKLPTDFQQFFAKLQVTEFFVTSLDRHIASIYTLPGWRQAEAFLESYPADPDTADDVLFNAADLGGQAEIDNQGRLLVPANLRRELGIENSPVRLKAVGTRIDVLSDQMYEERKERAKAAGSAAVTALRKAGLK
jgi:MraZ protein